MLILIRRVQHVWDGSPRVGEELVTHRGVSKILEVLREVKLPILRSVLGMLFACVCVF